MRGWVIVAVVAAMGFIGCGKDDEPTVGPPIGACCAPAGTCTVTTQASCSGVWAVAGVCSPNPCPQAGACCDPSTGACILILQTVCTSPLTWNGASSCTPNPCTQPPTGSCCAPAGTCTVTTQAACTYAWTAGGVCSPNPCTSTPPAGMIWIPAGYVRLGQVGVPNAEPVSDFQVEGFYIDRYEVSNAKFKAFIDAGGYTTRAYWNPMGWVWREASSITLPAYWNTSTYHGGGIAGNEQFPANGVSWWEADAYCRWAGVRLPTEAEWEKAAKGGCETHGDPGQCDASDTPDYPWGAGISGPRANYWGSGDPYENNGKTTPVGYYDGGNHGGYQTIDSPSPYGLYDVAGNVWEWCSTKYAAYPNDPNDGREDPPAMHSECCRVLRGGAYGYNPDGLRCATRYSSAGIYYPDQRDYYVGFRCARSN